MPGEFWEYDPPTDSWTQLPTFTGDGRWAPGGFIIDDMAYFFCGYARNTRSYHNDMHSYQFAVTRTKDPDKTNLQIFPNPTTDHVHIQSLKNRRSVAIHSSDGRQFWNGELKDIVTAINVKDWPSGKYYMRNSKGEILGSFIKQ